MSTGLGSEHSLLQFANLSHVIIFSLACELNRVRFARHRGAARPPRSVLCPHRLVPRWIAGSPPSIRHRGVPLGSQSRRLGACESRVCRGLLHRGKNSLVAASCSFANGIANAGRSESGRIKTLARRSNGSKRRPITVTSERWIDCEWRANLTRNRSLDHLLANNSSLLRRHHRRTRINVRQ